MAVALEGRWQVALEWWWWWLFSGGGGSFGVAVGVALAVALEGQSSLKYTEGGHSPLGFGGAKASLG